MPKSTRHPSFSRDGQTLYADGSLVHTMFTSDQTELRLVSVRSGRASKSKPISWYLLDGAKALFQSKTKGDCLEKLIESGRFSNGSLTVPKLTLRERFDTKWEADDGCHIWTAELSAGGYGRISVNSRPELAHRVAYELHHGAIPHGQVVRQTCGNPLCVHPEHVVAETR